VSLTTVCRILFGVLSLGTLLCDGAEVPAPPRYTLAQNDRWLLSLSGGSRFDASALLRLPDATLLTLNDKGLPAYRIELAPRGIARLHPDTNFFPLAAVRLAAGGKPISQDVEGLGQDDSGRIYLCEEGGRAIYRTTAGGPVEKLEIDWTPVRAWFDPKDGNASFEGIAVGAGRIYIANERSTGRILVVDQTSLKVIDDFRVTPHQSGDGDPVYSDLSWWRGHLWVLCRQTRFVLQIDPTTHRVLAEFDYSDVELAPENAYLSPLGFGYFEGLSVDDEFIWLASDNNGLPRRMAPTDSRGLLVRCRRPDHSAPPSRIPPDPDR
jgi:hypothetical protein